MDRVLIDEIDLYAGQEGDLANAIAGLAREDLLAVPVPNTWSIQQIILHLVDSDLILADRMKRVIAEENPLLIGFDESKFAAQLRYDLMDANLACEVFKGNRRLMSVLLKHIPDTVFQRTGVHNERGKVTLLDLMKNATRHVVHHLKFVHEKRKLLGK
jgi:hypothetical protein